MPSAPVMSPTPKRDAFQPPKGKGSLGTGTPILTPTMPALASAAYLSAVAPLCVYMDAAFPNGLAFSIANASSRESTCKTESTGPKISSLTQAESVVTPSIMVGPTQNPSELPAEGAVRPSRRICALRFRLSNVSRYSGFCRGANDGAQVFSDLDFGALTLLSLREGSCNLRLGSERLRPCSAVRHSP